MDVFTAMRERRSCRNFAAEAIDKETIGKLLEAATWAPSPMNSQPWEFLVITSADLRAKIKAEAESCKEWALEKSGWKWLGKYPMGFLDGVPVFIGVVANPKKSGIDQFSDEGPTDHLYACAAAIQNLNLAAQALGLGTLWFSFFRQAPMKEILDIPDEKTLLALVCVGKPAAESPAVPRKDGAEKTRWLE